MIEISRTAKSIKVEGHANYAEHGKDIVCAAVSVLTETLISSIQKLTDDKIHFFTMPGTAEIHFKHLSDLSKSLVDAFFIGINGVAESYPDYVKIKMTEL